MAIVYKDPDDQAFWHPFLMEKVGFIAYLAGGYWRTASWLDIRDVGLEQLEDLAFEFACTPRIYAVRRINLVGDTCTR